MELLLTYLPIIIAWVQSPIGTNALAAAIAFVALLGANTRVCLALTIALHLTLMLTF